MPLVLIRQVAPGVAFIHPLEGAVDPGFGVGGIGGVDPGYGHGIFGRPDQGLPGQGGHPSQGLPGGGYPSHGLPGSPGHPDNRPPATRPPQVEQNTTLVLVRDPEGVWHYATLQPGSPPPKPVPVPPPDHISGRPPGSGGGDHISGQPVPPGDWTPPARPDQSLPGAQPKK